MCSTSTDYSLEQSRCTSIKIFISFCILRNVAILYQEPPLADAQSRSRVQQGGFKYAHLITYPNRWTWTIGHGKQIHHLNLIFLGEVYCSVCCRIKHDLTGSRLHVFLDILTLEKQIGASICTYATYYHNA